MNATNEVCIRDLFIGLNVKVPLLDGSEKVYVNLDNAASTPPFAAVERAVNEFLPYYSSVHRGTGFKSLLSTHLYEQARSKVLAFLGADPREHTCIFGKNTTEAINKLARRFPFSAEKDVVIISPMEHHSNDLPWRSVARVLHVKMLPDGRLDEADFDALLAQYAGRVALVAVSGASNVTGVLNPIHRLAEKTHAAGAQIFVDCAQLAPHRQVVMGALDDPQHIDYTAISAHKMYAPFGTGALVGRIDTFNKGEPDMRGGGQVEFVSQNEVYWSDAPERDEAGSPNTVGAVALSAALTQLETLGMDVVAQHEKDLTAAAYRLLSSVPDLHFIGQAAFTPSVDRLGVIPVGLGNLPHTLVAAILGYEFGIGVRNGCFCAHPYLLQLLQVNEADAHHVRGQILGGDRRYVPGLVRISFGLYNSLEEVEFLVEALQRIQRGEYKGKYSQDVRTGEFRPLGWSCRFEDYLTSKK